MVGIKREKGRERRKKREIAINTEGSANISITPLDTKHRGCDVILFSEVLGRYFRMISSNVFTLGLSHLHDIVTDGLTSRIRVNPVYFPLDSPGSICPADASVRIIIREN